MHSFPFFAISEAAAKAPLKITTGAASAGGALPNDAAGNVPKYVLVSATADAYFRWGRGAQTAVATDILIPAGSSIAIATVGATHAAALQVSAAGVMTITALESK